MENIIYEILFGLLTLLGIAICTKKKILVHRIVEGTFLLVFIVGYYFYSNIIEGVRFWPIAIPVILFLLLFIVLQKKYTIYNVSKKEILSLINKALEQEKVKHEIIENSVLLNEKRASIWVSTWSNATSVNLKEIKDNHISHAVIKEIRKGLKDIEKKYLSLLGVVYILIGVAYFCWILF